MKRGRDALLAVGVALLVAVAAPAGTGVAFEGAGEPTEIAGCTAIDEPGEYVLVGDVENGSPTDPRSGLGACIEVRASDVTLRGGDHTLDGGDRPGVVGVLVAGESRSNVTVRNLGVTGWGGGVAVVDAADATLRNVSAVDNLGDGFFVENAPGTTIAGGTVRGSNTGVFVRDVEGGRIAGLTVADNIAGVAIRRSDGTDVAGVNASRNRIYGVGVFRTANAAVADSTLADNGFAGVVLSQTDAVDLRNLSVAPGERPGDGDPVGVYLNDSRGARLVDGSVADGPGWAFYATGNSTAVGEGVGLGSAALSFEVRDVALDSATGAPPLPTGLRVVGDPVFARSTGEDGRLSLSVEYADDAVVRTRTTGERLSLWRFDAGDGWQRVPTTVDAERNVASAEVGNVSRNGTALALVSAGFADTEGGTENGTA